MRNTSALTGYSFTNLKIQKTYNLTIINERLFGTPILNDFKTRVISAVVVLAVTASYEHGIRCTVQGCTMDAQQLCSLGNGVPPCWLYVWLKINHCAPPSSRCTLHRLPDTMRWRWLHR